MSLMAKFEPIIVPNVFRYSLTVNVVGNGTVTGYNAGNTYTFGSKVNLSAILGDDITSFEGWSGDVTSSDENIEVTMNGEKTITVTFADVLEDEALPEAGGIPAKVLSLFGVSMTGLGFLIRKKNNRDIPYWMKYGPGL